MTIFSIIPKSQLEGVQRLDAEYYQPEYLEIKNKLLKLKSQYLLNFSKFVRCGPFGSNLLCETYIPDGVVVIRPFNLNSLNANSGDLVSINKQDCMNQHLNIYSNEDVFFSRVGDVRFGIAQGFTGEITISPNIVAVRTNEKLDPYFLTLFLGTKYGYLQVLRGLKVVAQPTIQTEDVRKILIPQFNINLQHRLANYLRISFKERKKSEDLYSQAENLLLKELGLKDFEIPEDLTWVVDYSEVEKTERADGEYFQPKYKVLLEKIREYNPKRLGDIVSMKKGVESGSSAYQEEGQLFIRVSSLSKNGIEEKDQKYLSEELYQRLKQDYQPQAGEILLTKDATPGIAYVLKEPIEGIISGGILRLKLKSGMEPEFLALCMNSLVGKLQAERDAGGSVILHWKPGEIKNMLIPVLPKAVQQKIANLVNKSHQARKKSKMLLEEAKRKVEEMIEKGGN